MSFILDALKKAESERSRSAGPVLMDVRVVAQRQRLPAWAWVLGGVLLANLLLLGWILLRRDEPANQMAQSPAASTAASAAPAAQGSAPATPAVITPRALPPPMLPLPDPTGQAALPETEPVLAPQAAPVPPVNRAPRAAPGLPLLPRIDNLPTAQDLVAQGVALPALQLLLLAYDDAQANRYVLLNSRRLREGDEVAEGIRVESILPTGVILNAHGRRFALLAGS